MKTREQRKHRLSKNERRRKRISENDRVEQPREESSHRRRPTVNQLVQLSFTIVDSDSQPFEYIRICMSVHITEKWQFCESCSRDKAVESIWER